MRFRLQPRKAGSEDEYTHNSIGMKNLRDVVVALRWAVAPADQSKTPFCGARLSWVDDQGGRHVRTFGWPAGTPRAIAKAMRACLNELGTGKRPAPYLASLWEILSTEARGFEIAFSLSEKADDNLKPCLWLLGRPGSLYHAIATRDDVSALFAKHVPHAEAAAIGAGVPPVQVTGGTIGKGNPACFLALGLALKVMPTERPVSHPGTPPIDSPHQGAELDPDFPPKKALLPLS